MDTFFRVGAHEITLEGDICLLKAAGALSLNEVQFYHNLVKECLEQHGRNFALINMASSGLIDADARRWTADWHKRYRISGAALFGCRQAGHAQVGAYRILQNRERSAGLDYRSARENNHPSERTR